MSDLSIEDSKKPLRPDEGEAKMRDPKKSKDNCSSNPEDWRPGQGPHPSD